MNSGSSRDWIKGIHNINISFTIELRDQGMKFRKMFFPSIICDVYAVTTIF